jgi:type 1 glutamine amidotransferase
MGQFWALTRAVGQPTGGLDNWTMCVKFKSMKTTLRWCGLVLSGLAWVALAAAGSAAPAAKKINVLLITGDDVAVHPWFEVSQAIRQTLVAAGKFQVRVSEDPAVLESARALQRYDVIFLHYYNATTPTLSDTAKQNLLEFVKGGKGFCVSHLSSASFREWDEFKKLCGRYWVMGQSGHGPRGKFQVKVADPTHPITRGLEPFEADDELYAKLQGDAPIHVLLEADSDWSKKTEPLAFVLQYGQGRVFHETFGHDARAIQNPAVQKLLVQGVQWAATGKVE